MIRRFVFLSFMLGTGPALAGAYHPSAALTAELEALAADHPTACRLDSIGTSRQGRTIWRLELGRGDNVDDRPAMLIVGGIDGDFPVSSETALLVAEGLLSSQSDSPAAKLLDKYTIHIVPRANPDAIEVYFESPRREQRAALRPVDDDRDGAIDEDGPEDINGDGIITMMRVVDPEGEYLPDPVAPRLLKKADAQKGEKPVFKLYVEGTDNDADGEYNEDGPGGVDINRNFLHQYPEHQVDAGPHQISEPESKALIDFILGHPHIAIAVFYGRHDNLVKVPAADKKDATGRAPVYLHKDDVATYKQVGEKYREITGIKKTPKEAPGGAVFAWAYAQYGIPSFACRVWTRPKEKKKEKDKESSDAKTPKTDDKTADAGKQKSGDKKKAKKKPADQDAADWLKYSDEVRDGKGFVEWTPFEHPQLGAVEIGGFVPFFRTTPPAEQLDDIAEKQLQFIVDLGTRFPKLSLAPAKLERLSEQVYELETALVNDGYFATGIAMARQNRRVRPAVVRLDIPKRDILGGPIVERVWSVPGGGRHKLRWVFRSGADDVTVKVVSDKYGALELTVPLTGAADSEDRR